MTRGIQMVNSSGSESWERAQLARSKLEHSVLDHPAVTMIDMGYLAGKSTEGSEEIVLRIHIGKQWFENLVNKSLPFPTEIDGFRVILVSGDYEIE